MALTREKYKRVPDLYVTGKELVLKDGQVMWMQALNPLERDEAQSDAQVARARLVMALKSEHASDERMKVEAAFFSDGRADAITRLVNLKLKDNLMNVLNAIRSDPEWKERLEIVARGSEVLSKPMEEAEQALVSQINDDYVTEVQRRQVDEETYLKMSYEGAPDAQLIEEYVELYVDNRGGVLAQSEYELTEVWLAARVCDGMEIAPGEWDHSGCEAHQLHVYQDKSEVHALPEDLQQQMKTLMTVINMSVRDAKNSARQGSSSGSSPLPSEVEESTSSTPTETHAEPHGSSPQLSGTP